MRKGITPLIAVILLLLITISIAGIAFVFFGRTQQVAGKTVVVAGWVQKIRDLGKVKFAVLR